MPGPNRRTDAYLGSSAVRPTLILFAIMGIIGSPLLLTATPAYDGFVYVAFAVSFTIHCIALFGTVKYNQLALMACENILFFVLVTMFFLSGILPVSIASWEASGKYMFVDYPWYQIQEQKSGGVKNIETAFLSGVKVGVFTEFMLLSIATFFYIEYRMVQQMIEFVIEKKRNEDDEPMD